MKMLSQGSTAPEVAFAKRLLNLSLVDPKPGRAAWDGKPVHETPRFDAAMDKQVRGFQRANRLAPDGIIGPRTWTALGVQLAIQYDKLRLIPQPAPALCWRAAAAMILGETPELGYGVKIDKRGAIALEDDKGVRTDRHARAFIQLQGWRPMPKPARVDDLLEAMAQGPLWVAGVAHSRTGREYGHAQVYSAVWTDGTPSGTVIRVHDPWPNKAGSIYPTLYEAPRAGANRFDVWIIGIPHGGRALYGGTQEIFDANVPKPGR